MEPQLYNYCIFINKNIFGIKISQKEFILNANLFFNKVKELVKPSIKPLNISSLIFLRNIFLKSNISRPYCFTSFSTIKIMLLSISHYIYGHSHSSKKMHQQINLVKNTPFHVIVYGETGTGKESVARLLRASTTYPFIALDCGCLNKELAQSELFGHERGAFTGATQRHIGAFEKANEGILFLDEIGNLNKEVQVYLLRAIQEKKISRLGGNEDIKINVRIIAASNENLQEAVKKGEFREDLYHRLNEFQIHIPPLRERKKDIPIFSDYFLKEVNKELNKNITGIEKEVYQFFYEYEWPGNIRELRNVIRRAALLTENYHSINILNLPQDLFEIPEHNIPDSALGKAKNLPNIDLKETALKAEIDKIIEALEFTDYNKTKAAKMLNIDRKTLYNKLKEFEIDL